MEIKTPNDKKIEVTSNRFSVDVLRNPKISLDQNKSGQYGEFLHETSSYLQRVTQDGFWTTEDSPLLRRRL